MARRFGYSWNVDRTLFDHTGRFDARFCGRTFSSYREFQEQLKTFEEECLVTFRIRTSVLSAPGDPCVYRHVRMICTYGDDDKPSESVGIRRRRTKNRGCRAKFTVNQRNGFLVVGAKSRMLVHNHRRCKMEYRLDPAVRRLTPEQRLEVMRFLQVGLPSYQVRRMARRYYGKYLMPWDVNNLKYHLMDTEVPAGSWSELEELVRDCGDFSCTSNEAGRIDCISFCRREQADLFQRYPEVVGMDATYNVNRSRFCLVQFIITDGLGHGRCVMYSLMRNEKTATYITALSDFRKLMPDSTKLQTFVVDMSFAQMSGIRAVFPRQKILLCHFHMIRAIHRKSKERLVWHFVRSLMRTNSIAKFNALRLRLRRKFPAFYIYFCRVWLRYAHLWAVCYRSGTVCLGNQTNNRAESAHRWLKRELYSGDTLFNCCKRIWVSSHQMLVDFLCDVAVSRIRREVVSFNNPLAGVVPALTRYAAERVLREWDSCNSRMSVVRDGENFSVTEWLLARRIAFTVDLSKNACSCMFNQFFAMPCRHLVFACMRAKVPVGNLVANSRWLDKILDGVEPPDVTFSQRPPPERNVSAEVRQMRRARHLRQCMSPSTHEAMMDYVDTVMDAFELVGLDKKAVAKASQADNIPPLRERISQVPTTVPNTTAGLTMAPRLQHHYPAEENVPTRRQR